MYASLHRRLILTAFLLAGAPVLRAQTIAVGMTQADAIEQLGEPKGTINLGKRQSLVYDGGVVEIENGRVVFIDPQFQEKTLQVKTAREYEARQTAKGLVQHDGQWMTPEERDKSLARQKQLEENRRRKEEDLRAQQAARDAAQQDARKRYSEKNAGILQLSNGDRIDHSSLLEPGKITVVYFVLPSHDGSKQFGLSLREYVKGQNDVYLRRMEVPDLSSAVAKRYGVSFIPNFRVFTRSGLLVGPLGATAESARQAIENARRAEP